jgi:hypothetical protein
LKRRGRKSAAQTPAPKNEQVYGSKKNPKGSAASEKSASKIKLSTSIVKTLKDKVAKYNKTHEKDVSLSTTKAVMRRGMGAYSKSHRPTITGGAPNSRQAWGFARVNKFLKKKSGQKVKEAYVQDDDLLAKGGLLAPNGKKSNLTPEQYKLVRTPEFKAWFGDWENDPENASKILDENGEPLVVYHGQRAIESKERFYQFTPNKDGYIYFAKNKEYSVGNFLYEGNLYECFLNIRHLIDATEFECGKTYSESQLKKFYKKFGINYLTGVLTEKENEKVPFWYSIQANGKNFWGEKKYESVGKQISDSNYDGLVFYETSYFPISKKFIEEVCSNKTQSTLVYVVLNPSQVKLADGTNTTFDPNNPDIRYNNGGMANDLPVGKLAKGMSLSEVASKHGLSADALKAELSMGIETEMEHTDNPEIARAIALDHLFEDPKYYTKLKQMEGLDKHLSEITTSFANGGKINEVFSFTTPTKEKSRLTYLQQVLVRTQSFKKFFGDWERAAKNFIADNRQNFKKHYEGISLVLDYATLEPRVLYHGTRSENEFFRFDVTKEKGVGRPYGYFAYNKEYSEHFTTSSQRAARNSKPFLYNVFLDVKKPFYANTKEYIRQNRDASGWKAVITASIANDIYPEVVASENIEEILKITKSIQSQIGNYIDRVFGNNKAPFWRLMAADVDKDFKYFLMTYGYDGIFYGEEYESNFDPDDPSQYTYAVTIFDSKQVKLADGRNLNFDPLIDDIRYDDGGMMDEEEPVLEQNLPHMNKKLKLGALLFGDKYAEGGEVIDDNGNKTNNGKKGGYFKGRSHAEGGIKAINVDTGQLIEVEGQEVIITKGAVNDPTLREFEGEQLTNKQILSKINQSGGGVAFEDGGELHGEHTCGCSGKKYNYGGEVLEDFHIIRMLSQPYDATRVQVKKARAFIDDLTKKMI